MATVPTNDNRVSSSLRIVVVAPFGKDATLIRDLLRRAGIESQSCPDVRACITSIPDAGALLIAEEALSSENVVELSNKLAAQPSWSDIPLILLTTSGAVSKESVHRSSLRQPLGNVLQLERPVRPETLISTVQSALRTRQRQYQMREAQQLLLQSEKLAVAGRLAASIAHEINNPLSAVLNLLYLVRTTTDNVRRDEFLLAAERELARVSEITNQTLVFHRQPTAPAAIDIAGVLDSVLSLYQGRLRNSNVVIRREFEPVPSITAFGGELRQLFVNLVGNSLDAMGDGGTLTLRLRNVKSRLNGGFEGIRITVADNGSGVPREIQAKIFEPFVTTKENTGTGLGLWVGSKIVHKHGGKMRLRSSVVAPSGTVVSVFLPINQALPCNAA